MRPETTGTYVRRALGPYVDVEHLLPEELHRLPAGTDLVLRVDDGLEMIDARVTSIVHCAPPDNKPNRQERDACRPSEQIHRFVHRCRSVVRVDSIHVGYLSM